MSSGDFNVQPWLDRLPPKPTARERHSRGDFRDEANEQLSKQRRHQSRLGGITDEAARALDLIDRILAGKEAAEPFLVGAFRQLILDLDAVGAHREVTRAADFLAAAYGSLEDKPAETEA